MTETYGGLSKSFKVKFDEAKEQVKSGIISEADLLQLVLDKLLPAVKKGGITQDQLSFWFSAYFATEKVRAVTPEHYTQIYEIMRLGNAGMGLWTALTFSHPPFSVLLGIEDWLSTTHLNNHLLDGVHKQMLKRFPQETIIAKSLDPDLPTDWIMELL